MNFLKSNNRLLVVSHNFNLEGAPISLFEVTKGLKKKGLEILVISSQNGPLSLRYEKENIKTLIFDFLGNENIPEKLLSFKKILVNTIIGYKFIAKIPTSLNPKIFWCIRESEKLLYLNRYKDLKKDFFQKAEKVIFVSEFTRKNYLDICEKNSTTIYNGINSQKIINLIKQYPNKIARKKAKISSEDFIFINVGSICLRKGQLDYVLAAIKFLEENRSSKIKFLLIGASSERDYVQKIKETIKENRFEKQILIINETPNIFDYYLASDVFVCSSYIESFPRVVLEAMAFKKPIIAANVYGVKEQVDHLKEGLTYIPGDIDRLYEQMTLFYKDQDLRKQLATNAQIKLQENFSYKRMLDQYFKLITCVE